MLLEDYLSFMTVNRALLGKVVLWKLPQYRRPIDPKTGRMQAIDPDELYRMKILDVYKQMLENVTE